MIIRMTPRRIIRCEAKLLLPLPITTAWGQLRDFNRFASQDYFHAKVVVDGDIPRQGAGLEITHRMAWLRFLRRGRIVRWRENEGFAFSDLSRHGSHRGFPHVLEVRLQEQSTSSCSLCVRVSGRWTAPTPDWIARLWLRWVFTHVVRSIENQFLGFIAFRQKHLRN